MKSYKLSPISGEIVQTEPSQQSKTDNQANYTKSANQTTESKTQLTASNVYGDFAPSTQNSTFQKAEGRAEQSANGTRYQSNGLWTVKTVNKPSSSAPVHPGAPTGGEEIPPTAPSRQSVPRVPNRAHTELSVQGNQGENVSQFSAASEQLRTPDNHGGSGSNIGAKERGFKPEKLKTGGYIYDDCDINDVDPELEELTRNRTNGEIGTVGEGDKKSPVSGQKKVKSSIAGAMVELNDDSHDDDRDKENKENTSPENKKSDRSVTIKSDGKLIKTIIIAGQIEGHTQLPQGQKATRYEELIPQLVEIEEDDEIGGLLLILNTVGGDVEAGLALSELIAGMKKPTASLVLGGGHSIGVPLAVSTKRSFIVPSATMTLHPVRITGMILGAPQTYVYLNRMQERIIDFTCSHCNMSPDRFSELMLSRDEMSTDLGSVLDGKQAVNEGLIDSLGTLSNALQFLKEATTAF